MFLYFVCCCCCCCSFTLPPSFSSLTNSWRRLTCDSLTTGKEEENLSIAVLPKRSWKGPNKKISIIWVWVDVIVKTRMKFMFNRVGSRLSLPAFPRGPRLLKCSVTVSQFDGFSPVYIFIHVNPLLLHVMWPLYLRQLIGPQILGKQLLLSKTVVDLGHCRLFKCFFFFFLLPFNWVRLLASVNGVRERLRFSNSRDLYLIMRYDILLLGLSTCIMLSVPRPPSPQSMWWWHFMHVLLCKLGTRYCISYPAAATPYLEMH